MFHLSNVNAWAAVSYQNAAKTAASSVTTATIVSFNPGGAGNRVLVVGLTFGQGAPTGVAVTYGGVNLTLAAGTSVTRGNAHTEMWYLTAPSITAANIVATWTGNHDVVMGAVAFNGADQVTPVINGTTANATSTAVSLTITSAAGDMTMDTVSTLSVTSPFLSAPTKTQRWLDTTPTTVKGGGSTAAGAATVTHAWTAGSAVAWTASGVDIKAKVIGFEVGNFTKTTSAAAVTQVIPHGLGQTPKAIILWTEARADQAFSGSTPIAFRAAASAGATSGVLTLTINKPAGTVLNDVMVAAIGVRPNTATITAPAGWTLVRRSNQATATANSLAVYTKAAGAAEPANYAWTFSASTGSSGGIASFSGVDTLSPVDVENGQATASNTTHTAPAVTTTSTNDMVVTAHTLASSVTWTPPGGMTEAVDVASDALGTAGQSVEMNYVAQAAIGATAANTATANANGDTGNTETLTLRPAYQTYFAFGFSDGTTDGSGSSACRNGVATAAVARRMANKVLTVVKWDQTLLAEADLQSWDATSFTLNWTTNDTYPYIIHYLIMGGSDVSAKVVRWQMPTATGNVAVTGVGFEPTTVIHLHTGSGFVATPPGTQTNSGFGLGVMDFGGTQWATEMFAVNGTTGGDTQRAQATDAAIYTIDSGLGVTKKASMVSMDSGGFTVNFTTVNNTNQGQIYSLALLGMNVKAGSFLKTTAAAPVNQSVTGTGFAPAAVFFHSFHDVTQAAPVAQSRMSYGASDVVTSGSSAFSDLDGANPTNFQAIDKTSKAFMKMNNSTPVIDAEADLISLDPDGFTVNWTTNDAVATEILYMGLANLVNTEVKLISLNATRYPRGVLLQWKTGSELDNLGFNVYREVNGVRTKVNTSLVAGSGLSAGQGTTVNAELAYARWDLDRAAAPDGVVYWLEDIDFNGKITRHGPIVPIRGGVNAPEPTVAPSIDLSDLGKRVKDRRVFIYHNGEPDRRRERRGGVAAAARRATLTQSALAGQAAVKIGITRPGWYRVTQGELVAAGLSPGVDPRTLRLFVDGAELAMRVTTQPDGQFTSNDAIEFYATGLDTPYTDTRVYWLTADTQLGRRIEYASSAAGTGTVPMSFPSTVRRKDRSIYFAALKNGDKENWFGPLVTSDPTELTLTADNIGQPTSGTARLSDSAQLTVTLQGVTNAPGLGPDHHVGVLVNGVEIGEMAFVGQVDQEETFVVPASLLVEGDNTVTLIARGGDADISLVDELALTYPHAYRADADLLRATVEGPGPVTIGGFAGTAIRIVDITDPLAAIELAGTVRTDVDGFSSVSVSVSGAGPRTLLAFSDSTIASALFVEANHPSNWHDASQAHDYVLMSHRDFIDQVSPLVALRQQQGHTPAIVDVNDIYDEFSFGEKTPQAIKDFLQWARMNWAQAPRFVVLLGDATVDPRDYAGLGVADFVPTKQVPMSALALESASDDWFVDFDDDGLPDVPIGRLSVRTASQAMATIAKIVSYETSTPPPLTHDWTKDVLLVAGQSDDTSNFGQLSAAVGALVPGNYAVQRVFSDELSPETAHQTLVDRVNEGQLIVNYVGHGSVQLWGSDGSLLTNSDVTASWHNAARLPLVVAMNCLNGLFNQVYDEESLAEALQRAPQGGAVAVWASSSVTPPATQSLVNQELFRAIFQGTYATLGEAITSAKRVVTNGDLRRSWIFFGDPAMRLSGAPQPAIHGTPSTPPPSSPPPPPADQPASGPTTGSTIDVAANGDLQAAIDRAAGGDTIQLEAGATFVGNFVLPVKSGDAYVTIRTATPDAALPGGTARIDPAQAQLLAKIQSPNAVAALATAPGAHHYRLLFLEFGPNDRGVGDIIQLGDGSSAQSTLAGVPHDLEIDRCYIHGDAAFGQKRGVSLNSASTSIRNSYIADIKATDVGSQAISGWNGPGPYSIVNNYLEAAGENVLLGGADPWIANLVPSDVTLRLNYLNKPLLWRSQNWRMKNLVELRNAERVTIDGNVLEHNGPTGSAVLLMPRDQNGATPWARVEHVRFTNNIVRHAPAAITILDPNRTATDVVVRNNLFSDLFSDRGAVSGGAGRFLLVNGGADITIDHNTVFQDGGAVVYASGAATIGFVFTDNIVSDNARAVAGDGSSPGNGTIQRYFPGLVWLGNVVAGASASTDLTGNSHPASVAAVGFVSLANANYRLAATSPHRHAATDGTDPGYDVDAVAAAVPPSAISCPEIPSVSSSSSVAVMFGNPILAAGAAPAGITCTPPAGSLFPMGATTVACSTVDLLARTASCSTSVIVQLPAPVSEPTLEPAPVSAPLSLVFATPAVAMPTTATDGTLERAGGDPPATLEQAAGHRFSGASAIEDQRVELPASASENNAELAYHQTMASSAAVRELQAVPAPTSAAKPPALPGGATFATSAIGAAESTGEVTPSAPSKPATSAGPALSRWEPTDPAEVIAGRRNVTKVLTVDDVELTTDVPWPQVAGTTVTLKAKATGGVGPYQYQWRVFDGQTWSVMADWTESDSLTWTPEAVITDLRIMVGVRSAGNSSETPEARRKLRFVIRAAPPAPLPPGLPNLTNLPNQPAGPAKSGEDVKQYLLLE